MITLKTYQTQTLDALRQYLEAARVIGAKAAFDGMDKVGVRDGTHFKPMPGLETVPFVCLRLPTGGGKTLLAAHTVKVAADAYLEQEFPLVLWMVPTDIIRTQTLETLKNPGHPNYEALQAAFEGRVTVLDMADFTQITPNDLKSRACIIVGTIQTLRVEDTDKRSVYAHNENLEPHFTGISNTDGLERIEKDATTGPIRYSFRNLMALHRPLVIVDEAHKAVSPLSYKVWERVRASCIIEYTATPDEKSNILHNVSATELKAEEMIKLPIRLTEHRDWQEAVLGSINTRQWLHEIATHDKDYIRPIVLFQAEDMGQEITKDVLLKFLLEQEIPREKIAVVTGSQKELDGINLFARDCPIDFVITVEALKEGWDCSFAYVFCSVATVHSAKDVEQILGRVLRMPYAKRRVDANLNRAYAHVSAASWPNAVKTLHDKLVVKMGFEDVEADIAIEPAPPLPLSGGGGVAFPAELPPTVLELAEDLSAFQLAPEDRSAVIIERNASGGCTLTLKGQVPADTLARLSAAVGDESARENLVRHQRRALAALAPAERGVPFAVPQLCLDLGDGLEPVEDLLDALGWSLTDYSAELTDQDFRLTETGVQWEIDLREGHVVDRHIGEAEQLDLDLVDTGWTQSQLVQWLERRVRQADITQPVLLEFVRRAVAYLVERRALPLPALVRWRFVLAKVLAQRINQNRDKARQACYQDNLFGPQAAVATSFDYAFDFSRTGYAPHWPYAGHPYVFQRHYYATVGELKNSGEEFECAKALDMCRAVKHWARNLERRGFAIPLAQGRFYPDFVAELNDGRLLVVEYKGAHLTDSPEQRAKEEAGNLWATKSGGKALFLWARTGNGFPALADQIADRAA